MGKVLSVAARKVKRFNVENRAEKVISKDKPVPAPRHPSTLKEIDHLMKEHSGAVEELKKKHAMLDENLKSVYVTSTSIDVSKFGKPSDRSRLPSSRAASSETEFGYEEPEFIPKGKITLKQALRVLTDKQYSASGVTVQTISNALNIKEEDAGHLIKHFSSFEIHMPEGKPQLSASSKVTQLLKSVSSTKVVSVKASETPLQINSSPSKTPD